MRRLLLKTGKSLLVLLLLLLGLFFFYVDWFIFRYVLWPSWKTGSLQLHESLSIYKFTFRGNLAYLPFLIYLMIGLFLLYIFARMICRIWFRVV